MVLVQLPPPPPSGGKSRPPICGGAAFFALGGVQGSRTQGGADRSGRMSGHGWPRKPPRPPAERRHGCRSASRSTPPPSTIAKKSNLRPGPSGLARPPWRPVPSPTTPRSALDEVLAQCTDIVEYQLARAVEDQLGRAYNRTSHLSEHRKMMRVWADYLDGLKRGRRWSRSSGRREMPVDILR